jgi:hypothetical protein
LGGIDARLLLQGGNTGECVRGHAVDGFDAVELQVRIFGPALGAGAFDVNTLPQFVPGDQGRWNKGVDRTRLEIVRDAAQKAESFIHDFKMSVDGVQNDPFLMKRGDFFFSVPGTKGLGHEEKKDLRTVVQAAQQFALIAALQVFQCKGQRQLQQGGFVFNRRAGQFHLVKMAIEAFEQCFGQIKAGFSFRGC